MLPVKHGMNTEIPAYTKLDGSIFKEMLMFPIKSFKSYQQAHMDSAPGQLSQSFPKDPHMKLLLSNFADFLPALV